MRYGDLNAPPGSPARGRQLVCYKTSFDPVQSRVADASLLTTDNFRTGGRRPETVLLGGAFQNYFDAASPQRPTYHVVAPSGPLFAGTGWKAGDAAADVIGYEWDNRDPDKDGRRLFTGRAQPARPRFRRPGSVPWGGHGSGRLSGARRGDALHAPSGARVFNAGAIRWAWGLGKPTFVNPAFQQFNANLIRSLSAR